MQLLSNKIVALSSKICYLCAFMLKKTYCPSANKCNKNYSFPFFITLSLFSIHVHVSMFPIK